MQLLGYAADGFPVYSQHGFSFPMNAESSVTEARSSYRLIKGQRRNGPGGVYDGTFVQDYEYVRGAGDLDECNGRFGVTPEYPQGIYHDYITTGFPFIPRYYRGTPDPSFRRRVPPGGPDERGGRGMRPGEPPGGRRHQPPWARPPIRQR